MTSATGIADHRRVHRLSTLFFLFALIALFGISYLSSQDFRENQATNAPKTRAYFTYKPARDAEVKALKRQLNQAGASSIATVPVWSYDITSSRDGYSYSGMIVGSDPRTGGTTTSIQTFIVPLKIITNTVGTNYQSTTNTFSTKPGVTNFNPSAANEACLGSTNNVPLTLVQQSPLFQSTATFTFGGTDVGATQYIDAFERANFYAVDDHDNYHVLLNPVTTLNQVTVNVPKAYGTTMPKPPLSACGHIGIVDVGWFDDYLTGTLIPSLASQGVGPTTFPIFLVHDVVWASPVTNLNTCCVGGYHSALTTPSSIQTYAAADFDYTGHFGVAFLDTVVLSHEIAEWANDPFGNNETPGWRAGDATTGFCQRNLEVGDPLIGTLAPTIAMSNGFSYHLQELAFFNWFFGKPSNAIYGWFSLNDSFYGDAGPPC